MEEYRVDTADIDLALRLVRHSSAPGMQLGFALRQPIPVILELPGAASHDLYPFALAASTASAATRGELDHMEGSCQEALEASQRLISQHERRWVEFLITVARQARLVALGQWRESAAYSEEAARIALQDGREAAAATMLAGAATSYTMAGDPQAGVDIAKRALGLARATGAPTTISFCLVAFAGALAESELVQARQLLEEALTMRQSHDIETTNEATQATLIAARMADWPLTLQLADRSIRHLQWGGQRPHLAGVLNVVARALADTDMEAAARLQGAARHLAVQIGAVRPMPGADAVPVSPGTQSPGFSMIADLRRQTTALLQAAFDEGRLRQLRAEGEAMDSDQAATYALEAIGRARQSTRDGPVGP
jgi:hypothetical protein